MTIEADTLLAQSTLCTVTKLEGDMIEVQIGHSVVRLPSREVASLTGTLQRVVRRVFTSRGDVEHRRACAFTVIEGGKR